MPSTAGFLRTSLSTAAVAMVLAGGAQSANALTLVSNIDGCYDCVVYDTPSLQIHNTTSGPDAGTFTNVQLTVTPYQPGTLTFGLAAQSRSLADIASGTTGTFSWLDGYAGTIRGDLFSYDFDDSYGNTPGGYTNANCVVGSSLCSLVGNFKVTFTATVSGGTFNGQPIFAEFSPTTNLTGGFLGWEGLDPTGLSESIYDQHSTSTSTVNGGLADIYLGTPPSTPLPAALPLFVTGLGGLALLGRRRKRKTAAAA